MGTIELENKLKGTDLSRYKMNDMEKFIMGVLKYRNFKTDKGLAQISELWEDKYTKLTARFYFDTVAQYFRDKSGILSTKYKEFIDRHRDVVAEMPELKDLRKPKSKRNVSNPIVPQPKAVQPALTEKFYYGLRFNGCCMITFATEKEQEMFIRGLEMADIIKSYTKIEIKQDAITEVH